MRSVDSGPWPASERVRAYAPIAPSAAISTSSATTPATAHGDRRGAGAGRADGVNGSGPGSAASRCPVALGPPGAAAAGRWGGGRHPGAGAPPGGVQRPGVGGPDGARRR